jgi:hypothetical protein
MMITAALTAGYLPSHGAGQIEHGRAMAMAMLTLASAIITMALSRLRTRTSRVIVFGTLAVGAALMFAEWRLKPSQSSESPRGSPGWVRLRPKGRGRGQLPTRLNAMPLRSTICHHCTGRSLGPASPESRLPVVLLANRGLGISTGFEDICSLVLPRPHFRREAVKAGRTCDCHCWPGCSWGERRRRHSSRMVADGDAGMLDRALGLGPR